MSHGPAAEEAESHRRTVEAWREARYAALRREIGWLTLAGLGWLRPGTNTVGSDPGCDVMLPAGPATAGRVEVTPDGVFASGAFVHEGRPAADLRLVSDRAGEPTMLELGPLRMCLIERGEQAALRTWDVDAPSRAAFAGIEHWPVDPRWRVVGRLEPTPGRRLTVPDVLGIDEEQEAPADVVFELDGQTHRLQGLRGGDRRELWLIFSDATNGDETYGGGRFLYTSAPDADGNVVVDFNRTYNPPCVFSPFATCPLPWPANRLPVRITAGEKTFHAG